MTLLIGIDVGGTFTDAVVFESGTLRAAFKLPSTPADPAEAVLAAVDRIGASMDIAGAVLCHGTTVGTNTLVERKGARTALLATRGFADVIELRRQARPNLYGFDIRISEPLVAPELRFGVDERIGPAGEVATPLSGAAEAAETVRQAGADAVAIGFLHSYANGAHETEMAALLREHVPGLFVTCSNEVCPEFREYERISTAVVNAYIGPAVGRYVTRLDRELASRGVRRLLIVKSNGGLTSPDNAVRSPVHLIESGPAAGLTAAAAYARAAACPNLIAFDMGGTTAKAGVVRSGRPDVAAEFYADQLADGRAVGGHAIRSPVLDLVEIGAGGGSLAWIDEAGVLKVGPGSAGADPGPACHGRGTRPTVTDAHAVIGTLDAEAFANTGLGFDREGAVAALTRHIAEPLGWDLARAAYAVFDIAVASMAQMARLVTVQRGLDPRDFAILAAGGAGPLHAAAIAAELGVPDVIVPPYPGLFSALGAVLAPVRHEVSRSLLRPLAELPESELAAHFEALRRRAEALLAAEPGAETRFERVLEARFVGQLFELRVPLGSASEPVPAASEIEARFRTLYAREYGFELAEARVQAVTLRLSAEHDLGLGADALFREPPSAWEPAEPHAHAPLLGRDGSLAMLPVFRAADAPGTVLAGPAIIRHAGSTIRVHANQTARIGRNGHVAIALPGGRG